MIRRPPRSTRKESSAASDVYKRQTKHQEDQSKSAQKKARRIPHKSRHRHKRHRPEKSSRRDTGDNYETQRRQNAMRKLEAQLEKGEEVWGNDMYFEKVLSQKDE
eukprot:TRINITY_DN7603_c0_g1_i5.p1 TRINITY_DN7603_c0_g1~~TRINITY_DN7603_c0_g1_i5.p1  ORF type:complete len:112 (+),score=33.50 TRINITY_DN7603_c0_g1_i5:23-337(+)